MFRLRFKWYHFLSIGLASSAIGSVIFYLLRYKNESWVQPIFITLVMVGWGGTAYGVFPDAFSKRKKSSLHNVLKIICIAAWIGAACLNINYITDIEKVRQHRILTQQPSIVTTAKIISTEMRALKNGSRRYIHLQYIANGQPVFQEMPDDSMKFDYDETYKLRYSIEYPKMFELYK